MAAAETIEGTAEPAEEAGLPQMNSETFPSQIFWLVITFGLLFLVLWRVTLPMIAGVIGARKNQIEGDLGTAENLRKDAASALHSYEAALAQARSRAHQMADDNKKRLLAEIERAKAAANAEAQAATAAAETRIAGERTKAAAGVTAAATEAAAAIVERLIGVPVSPDDAAKAVASVTAKAG